jgi:hypothetical protein
MSFSKQILTGLLAGVAVGIFLGEHAAIFSFAATGFVKLLQVTVLPYMTVSIVANLGRLDYAQACTLALKAGSVLLSFWGIGLGLAFLFPLAFPVVESARFFSTTLVEPTTPFNFIELYIPSNPFYALANNIVPGRAVLRAARNRVDGHGEESSPPRRAHGRGNPVVARDEADLPAKSSTAPPQRASLRTACSRSPRTRPARSTSSSSVGCRYISSSMVPPLCS